MTPEVEQKLKELYKIYNETIKLLIADIEARTQKFPIEIFNEIRSFNDHVARCYLPEKHKVDHDVSLDKWQETYNKYTEIFDFVSESDKDICWARKKFFSNKIKTVVVWLATLIVAWILGHFKLCI